jgi:hypothetical protein
MRLPSATPPPAPAAKPARAPLPAFDPEPLLVKGWDVVSAARVHLWQHGGPPHEDILARHAWAAFGHLDHDAAAMAADWLAENDPAPF